MVKMQDARTRDLSADRRVRLSSAAIKILPNEQDLSRFLFLDSCFSLMSNAERRVKNEEVGNH
jgi:hypothetical protein